MPAKAPFTQHEAVLLLNAYLKVQSGTLEWGDAVRGCSSKLRQIAINANLNIDDSYRNVKCIWPQIRRMESAYEGRTVRLPATQLFAETVSLYRDNPAKYHELLQEAEGMAGGGNEGEASAPSSPARPDEAAETEPGYGGGGALEKAFCRWLKEDRHLAEAECGEQVSSIKRAECFAQENALASRRLFTEDFSEAMATAAALFGNAEFVRLDAEQGNCLKKAITDLLAFYASGGGEARLAQGETRGQDANHLVDGAQQAAGLEDEFLRYLKEEKRLAERSCSNYVYYIKRAERFAQENGLSSTRLFTEDAAEAKATADALFADEDFVQHLRSRGNNFGQAIRSLLAFYASGEGEARLAQGPAQGETRGQDANHLVDGAPQAAGLEGEFLRYLKEETLLAERSCGNYVHDIRRAEQFARERGLASTRLFTEDAAEAKATAAALFADESFVRHNKDWHNRFSAAIRSLLAFYASGGGAQDVNHLEGDTAFQPGRGYGGGKAPDKGVGGIEIAFLRHLKEETSLAERTRSNYVYYIRTAERFARENGLSSTRLFTEDAEEAAATADALFADEEFIKYNKEWGNRISAAIRSLLAFYASGGGEQDVNHLEDDTACETGRGYGAAIDGQDMDQLQLIEQLTEPSFDVEPYLAIIEERFANGYRLASPIDADKMREYFKEMTGAEMPVDADALAAALRRRYVVCNGKAYAPQSLLDDEMKAQILSFVEGCLEGGAAAVYYKAIFERFEDELVECGSKIRGEEMLKAYLQRCAGSGYCFGEDFLAREGLRANPMEDLRRYLEEQCAPVSLAAICRALPHIDAERIEGALRRQGEFLQNGKDEFFFADALQLEDAELEAIARLVEERGSIAVDELYEAIQKNCADAFERNAVFSAVGWKNALKQRLGGRGFAFGEKVVSVEGAPKSKIELFARCVSAHAGGGARLSLEQLEQYAESCGLANIPFDALYARGDVVRVSRDLFVPKGDVWFSVAETDAALERFFGGQQYMMIGDIEKAVLPAAAFAWTEFLLEQYAAFYSEEFCLLHKAFNKKSAFGAIVKRSCRFGSLDELLLDGEGNA